jgi:uncharacterized delta-60 repeat protein
MAMFFTAVPAYASPGDLDTTFDPGPILWQGFAFPAFKHAIVLQPDGKVVIGGQFDSVQGVPRIMIARLNANGSLDTTFSAPLQTITISGSQEGEVYDIIQQPDGKFIVSGYFNIAGQWKTVVRLNNDGSLDGGFNVTTTGLNPEFNHIYRMLLQPDGKIVIGSNSLTEVNGTPTGYIARLTSTGALDTPLGVTGNVFFSIFSLALQTDGKIVAGGGDGSGRAVARLNSDGTPDQTFTPPFLGTGGSIRSLAIEADGQILAGSNSRFSINGGPLTDGLIRLNTDGSYDASFNPPDIRTAWTLYVQSDGKIAVGGSFTVNFGLFLSTFGRLNPDGSLDFMCNSGPDNDLLDIVRQPDGKYIVSGTFEFFDQGATRIVRTGVARILETQSPLTGKIVFDSKPTPTSLEIASINPDGTNRTPLTTSGFDYGPSVSANGSKIAFISLRDNTSEEIYIMNGDGSGQTRLTTNDDVDLDPSITADGTKIAFASLRDGNWEIYTMNSAGGNLQRVTTNTFRDEQPAFSPDGSKIAFRSNRDGDPEIYIMNADGSNPMRLTTDAANDLEPAFSPDGTRIVWRSSRDGNFEIYSMNVNGTNQVRLTNDAAIDSDPAFSPDGSRIVFVSQRDGNPEIYYMNANGSGPVRITNNAFEDGRPSWGGLFTPTPPVLKMNIAGGNVLVGSPGAGIILRSPNGTVCIKIGIDNAGAMTTTITPCP